MNPEQTQAAWQSRTNMMALAGIAAFWLQRQTGIQLPVEVQGMAVDLVPLAITGFWAGAIWFRNKARAIVNRWL